MKTCFKKLTSKSFDRFLKPLKAVFKQITPLISNGDRPLKMTFEDQLKILTYYHLEEHTSGRHLLQALEEDEFAQDNIAPEGGIKKSSFFEAINSRGLEQMMEVFELLKKQASDILPVEHSDLGNLIAIDGSLIDAVLSMDWAQYRKKSKKAKAHVGFNINKVIPYKAFITNGNGGERPFVNQILEPGQTSVTDRGYQCHKSFDLIQEDDTFNFVDLNEFAPGKQLTLDVRHADGSSDKIMLNHTYNEAQIEWFKEGSALNLIKKENASA